jgi:IS30 family transposase
MDGRLVAIASQGVRGDSVTSSGRKAFADAQTAGLSLREIAKETGLHHSTVAEIARGG